MLPSPESPTGDFVGGPSLNSKDKRRKSSLHTCFPGDFGHLHSNTKTRHQIWRVMIIILSYIWRVSRTSRRRSEETFIERHVPDTLVGIFQWAVVSKSHSNHMWKVVLPSFIEVGTKAQKEEALPAWQMTGQDSRLELTVPIALFNVPSDFPSPLRNLHLNKRKCVISKAYQSKHNKELEKVLWSVTHTYVSGTWRIWNKRKFIPKLREVGCNYTC